MTLDFIDRLSDAVNSLELELPIHIGLLDREDSLALYSIAGGKTIKEFYDGAKDKLLNYEISVKTKQQERAIKSLDSIAQYIEGINSITSKNDSYEFQNILISSESYYVGQDETGFFFYRLTFQTKLTIYKGDI